MSTKINEMGKEIIEQITNNQKCYLILIKPDYLERLKEEQKLLVANAEDKVNTFGGVELVKCEHLANDWELLGFDNRIEKEKFKNPFITKVEVDNS